MYHLKMPVVLDNRHSFFNVTFCISSGEFIHPIGRLLSGRTRSFQRQKPALRDVVSISAQTCDRRSNPSRSADVDARRRQRMPRDCS